MTTSKPRQITYANVASLKVGAIYKVTVGFPTAHDLDFMVVRFDALLESITRTAGHTTLQFDNEVTLYIDSGEVAVRILMQAVRMRTPR